MMVMMIEMPHNDGMAALCENYERRVVSPSRSADAVIAYHHQ